ncbi:hypothetical protein [Halosimplex sp. TS25]|uniref:DUF7269 family protein n=1 Tax=Halosimplex rarum TaxID=3396619 RepID=UPI0039EB260C
MHGPLRAAFGVVGAFATGLAVLSVGAPDLVAETEPLATLVGAASALGPRTLFVLGSAAVGLYLFGAVWKSPEERLVEGDRSGAERFERLVTDAPETVTAPDRTLAANDFDAAVDRAVDGDERAMDQIRDRIRRLAVARLERGGWDDDSAADAVATGKWTDDRIAAAFLSGADGVVPSLRSRLRLWLDPATERERRVRQTVAAVDAIAEDERIDGETGDDADTDGTAPGVEPIRDGGVGE